MKQHKVRTYKSVENLLREDQLAWKIASVAADDVPLDADVAEMIGNRIIDNAAVAAASLARDPVASARAQAQAHPFQPGATMFGLPPELSGPSAWANRSDGVAGDAAGSASAGIAAANRPANTSAVFGGLIISIFSVLKFNPR